MKITIRESRASALAFILFMTVIPVLADDNLRRSATLIQKEDPAEARHIVVSIQDCKLALIEGDKVVKIWDAAVGTKSSPSPSGNFAIASRLSQPTYYHPGKIIPSGPSNPLGTRWLGLNLKGFGIHGTNAPRSIGKKASHGCIRMRNRDIEELFEMVKAGDAVEIYAERTPALVQIFKIDEPPASSPVLSASVASIGSN
jgi:hypothetical protein